jgi:hypothetical protein
MQKLICPYCGKQYNKLYINRLHYKGDKVSYKQFCNNLAVGMSKADAIIPKNNHKKQYKIKPQPSLRYNK